MMHHSFNLTYSFGAICFQFWNVSSYETQNPSAESMFLQLARDGKIVRVLMGSEFWYFVTHFFCCCNWNLKEYSFTLRKCAVFHRMAWTYVFLCCIFFFIHACLLTQCTNAIILCSFFIWLFFLLYVIKLLRSYSNRWLLCVESTRGWCNLFRQYVYYKENEDCIKGLNIIWCTAFYPHITVTLPPDCLPFSLFHCCLSFNYRALFQCWFSFLPIFSFTWKFNHLMECIQSACNMATLTWGREIDETN